MASSFKRYLFITGLAVSVAGCSSTAPRESAGEYINDSWITTKIKSEFVGEKINPFKIHVTTTNGVVKLTGTADTQREAKQAVEVAHGVQGVKAVESDLAVRG
jgi:osmotically-inducible protein OsmY